MGVHRGALEQQRQAATSRIQVASGIALKLRIGNLDDASASGLDLRASRDMRLIRIE